MRRHDLFWGLILVIVGVVLVLDRLLGISVWKVAWPLFLIGLGLWFTWTGSHGEQRPELEEVTIPLEGAERARILMQHGAGQVRVDASADVDELVAGTFTGGLDHDRALRGDTVHVRLRPHGAYISRCFMPWIWGRGLDWQVGLSRRIPLSLKVDAGMSSTSLDLSQLQVIEFRLKTGLSSTEVTLPASAGHTRAHVDSGLASVKIRVPEGVAARIETETGLGSTSIDRRRFPRKGNVYQSEDYDMADNKVEIQVKTGLGSVTIR